MANGAIQANFHLSNDREVTVKEFHLGGKPQFASVKIEDGFNQVVLMFNSKEDAHRFIRQMLTAYDQMEEVQCQQ